MPILAGLLLLIQFCFVYHVFKTGRPYWWMFIIMAFPVMGCLIYYFVEVFPGSREMRKAHRTARTLARVLQPDADLKKRAEEVEICGSVDNRMALAQECLNHGMYVEAIRLYESCLQGAFASDPAALFGLARAAVEGGATEKALATIARLKADAPKMRPLDVRLLEARALDDRGESDAAIAVYRELLPVFTGLEARYRYGVLLLRLGKQAAALDTFNEVVRHAGRFASSLEAEQQWVDAARERIAGR